MEKKINLCVECGNSDDAMMYVVPVAPWVVECMVCGHPNDNVAVDV